jgi:uroporphyrinogen-III decarboxylase
MACKMSGCPRVFIPLHRGAAGFMSNEQFAKFYWPSVKAVIEGLIDIDLTPMPFWEGNYTPRLEFLAELPKGQVASWFDTVDVQKAKEIIGDNLCFYGNVPAQLLVTGTPEEVKDYVKMLIDTFSDTGGLIINGSVDGVPNEAKHENVMAVTEVVQEYGVY